MISITKEDFIKMYIENNKDYDKIELNELKEALDETVTAKSKGVKCSICGNPIWAIGSAVSVWDACFTCISGEADSSEDY